ncbi:MAG: hypothetical protein DRJ67_10410, partial [Thermoprotei archaeon]
MYAALEYVAIGLVAVVLVLSTLSSMHTLVQGVKLMESEQLYTVAERVLNKVLLTPGRPINWGTDLTITEDNMTDFGLALAGSHEPYVLDPDKLMRLVNYSWFGNPAFLDPRHVASLLKLEGYGFMLEFAPLFTLRATPLAVDPDTGVAVQLDVTAINYEGEPLANVNVTGLLLVLYSEGGCGSSTSVDVNHALLRDNEVTGIDGSCTLDFTSEFGALKPSLLGDANKVTYALLLYGEWHGYRTTSHYAPDQGALNVYLIGPYVIAEYAADAPPHGAVILESEALEAIPDYSKLVKVRRVVVECVGDEPSDWTPACRVVNKGAKFYQLYRLEHVERLASHAILVGCRLGRLFAYVASKYPIEPVRYG